MNEWETKMAKLLVKWWTQVMRAGRQRETCVVMVEPDCCVIDRAGQSCLCGSFAFCSAVGDSDHSEPGAERWQGY